MMWMFVETFGDYFNIERNTWLQQLHGMVVNLTVEYEYFSEKWINFAEVFSEIWGHFGYVRVIHPEQL